MWLYAESQEWVEKKAEDENVWRNNVSEEMEKDGTLPVSSQPLTSIIHTTCELVPNADFQAIPQPTESEPAFKWDPKWSECSLMFKDCCKHKRFEKFFYNILSLKK